MSDAGQGRGTGQDTYGGVPKPQNIVRAERTGFQDDPYVTGWKDGVDAACAAGVTRPVSPGDKDQSRDRDTGQDTYRGVPLSPHWDEWTDRDKAQWKDGVDAHWDRTVRLAAERDKDKQDRTPPEVSAFLAVTEDRTRDALRIVDAMSGRDRAVLSFWLKELSGVLEDAEASRRLSF